MAYLVRRPSGTLQVRECVRTPDGPRSRTLASFSGALDDAVLAEAERRATQPIDRARLVERARALGAGWQSSTAGAARRLVHGLRRGGSIDPVLRHLVRAELEGAERSREADVPGDEAGGGSAAAAREFEEAAEWIGASAEERAASLRGLLRLGDAIARSRGPRPVPADGLHPESNAYPALSSHAESNAYPALSSHAESNAYPALSSHAESSARPPPSSHPGARSDASARTGLREAEPRSGTS